MVYGAVKRILDIILSASAMIVLLPVFFITAIGVYISNPGPILFKAKRVGKNGIPFTMLKFRSMRLNNEKGHMITLRNDNRIFPFGRFIRKAKIDELPQLINIIQGKMSVVGWRPEDEENINKVFTGKYKEILEIRPGLTSPGSLYDYTHGEKFEDEALYERDFLPRKMDLELYYKRNQSLIYDFLLVLRTIKTIVLISCGKENLSEPEELKRIQKDNTYGKR